LTRFFAKIARITATRSEMALLGDRDGDRKAGARLIMLNGSRGAIFINSKPRRD
jgi:hypothetical protein